jgi:hypothetical protein
MLSALPFRLQPRGFELRNVAGGWRIYSPCRICRHIVGRFVLEGRPPGLLRQPLKRWRSLLTGSRSPGPGYLPFGESTLIPWSGLSTQRGFDRGLGNDPESGAVLYRTTSYFLERMGMVRWPSCRSSPRTFRAGRDRRVLRRQPDVERRQGTNLMDTRQHEVLTRGRLCLPGWLVLISTPCRPLLSQGRVMTQAGRQGSPRNGSGRNSSGRNEHLGTATGRSNAGGFRPRRQRRRRKAQLRQGSQWPPRKRFEAARRSTFRSGQAHKPATGSRRPRKVREALPEACGSNKPGAGKHRERPGRPSRSPSTKRSGSSSLPVPSAANASARTWDPSASRHATGSAQEVPAVGPPRC